MSTIIPKKPPIDFQSIRESRSLIDVAGRDVGLIENGSEYKCLCPFHDDRKPSCTFFPGNDGHWRYYCFACDAGGDVIDFVAAMNNVKLDEAARILTGGAMPVNTNPVARPSVNPDETDCWEPIIPVPEDAPEYYPAETYNPKAAAFRRYKPKRLDPYFDGDGNLICYVSRLEFSDKKITPVITYCEGPGGERLWCSKRMKEPYPIMGLDELAARPTAHVLVVSGEKCKVAASARLPKSIVITTMGGDGAVVRNDLTPLYGRNIVLWPDADDSGRKSMYLLGKHLAANRGKVRHIDTTGQKKGFDVADLLETSISDDDLIQHIKSRVRDGNLPKPPTNTMGQKPPRARQKAVQVEPEPVPNEPKRAEPGTDPKTQISLKDFRAHKPDHRYIFIPTRDLWPASSVDSSIEWPDGPGGKMKPSRWLDANQSVEQMTWAPGLPLLIENKLIDTGGWIDHYGCTCFNQYRPPTLRHGDASKADPWLQHLAKVYPDDVEHITRWLAHRVQHSEQKLNHALVLGGKHGIGKDTILEPVKMAVGPWNCHEVSPGAMLGRFNGFVKSVILRVSEARDLGDVDRFAFYDHTKALIAAPPDVIRVDEKNVREYPVPNLCGVIITTNHKSDGLYLPADDRRHYVAWSDLSREEFDTDYWNRLWQWYDNGGIGHVAAYLANLDLAGFDPKAPPEKTEAFWHIVNAARPPEESELADIMDKLNWPNAITMGDVLSRARMEHPDFAEWLSDRRNRRQIPHRLESAGYEPVRNKGAKDGYFVVNGKRQSVYARSALPIRERHAAAARLDR